MADALCLCMQTTPIDRISIKTITDICGLNRQTFYYHFKDIYDLVQWMYVTHINHTIDKALSQTDTREEALRATLVSIDGEQEYYQAIYESRRYYPRVRREIVNSLTTRFHSIFEPDFRELGFDDDYSRFLCETYAVVVFEFVERHARGTAIFSIDGFVEGWARLVRRHLESERRHLLDGE